MKAAVCTGYGAPEVLSLQQVPVPSVGADEIKVRVIATAVNSGDCRIRRADPFAVRLFFGLNKPRRGVLGGVFSGIVEEIGSQVHLFKVGDEVFGSTGMSFGAYAAYKVLPENATIALKPTLLTHAEAATIPFGATTALHFLRKANLKKGQQILVLGASGAVGTAAVQLAVYFGAEVTAVCSSSNIELVRSLGAKRVIDYKNDDYSKLGETYDVVFDTVNKDTFANRLGAVKRGGTLILGAAGVRDSLQALKAIVFRRQKILLGAIDESAPDLNFLKTLIEGSHLRPVIDRRYTLDQIVEAHRYVDAGHKKGNVSVEI